MHPKGMFAEVAKKFQEMEDMIKTGVKEALKAELKAMKKGKGPSEESDEEGKQEDEEEEPQRKELEIPTDQRTFLESLKTTDKDSSEANMEIPTYSGQVNAEELVDWIDAMNNYFEYKEVAKEKKLYRRMQNFKQKDLDVASYTEEFHKLSLRLGHREEGKEKVAKYLNGLKFNIQDEISSMTPKIVDECFQMDLRVEDKLKRKGEQYGMGRGGKNSRGKGNFGGRGQSQKPQGSGAPVAHRWRPGGKAATGWRPGGGAGASREKGPGGPEALASAERGAGGEQRLAAGAVLHWRRDYRQRLERKRRSAEGAAAGGSGIRKGSGGRASWPAATGGGGPGSAAQGGDEAVDESRRPGRWRPEKIAAAAGEDRPWGVGGIAAASEKGRRGHRRGPQGPD
ncbi:uncharacterized protein LOC131875738 [Cryptomeria japonica]|uniref:uncharacterized protein LOC131875738 n=1 Tax=Cryptomeria japonica TaxID=3369 RepID=UPI0027DAA47A|nr:uncharacterized protein LOC131875738 [Cryptomeria japonica]